VPNSAAFAGTVVAIGAESWLAYEVHMAHETRGQHEVLVVCELVAQVAWQQQPLCCLLVQHVLPFRVERLHVSLGDVQKLRRVYA
jgi:hypothetical protein